MTHEDGHAFLCRQPDSIFDIIFLDAFTSEGAVPCCLSMAMLQKRGYTHALTLADDRGSGKLRAWYEQLGFVGARIFQDTAMVARTSQPHAQEQ